MKIEKASIKDAPHILALQKLAYQSEAAIYNDYSIPPLVQDLSSIRLEFDHLIFLKAVHENEIIGSVRAAAEDATCLIGRLIVHPLWQRKGIGSKLLNKIETCFTDVQRFELFTGSKSRGNIRLYENMGYKVFREKPVTSGLTLVFMEKKHSTLKDL